MPSRSFLSCSLKTLLAHTSLQQYPAPKVLSLNRALYPQEPQRKPAELIRILCSCRAGRLHSHHHTSACKAVGEVCILWAHPWQKIMVRVGRDLKLISFYPLPWAGTYSTIPGCSKPRLWICLDPSSLPLLPIWIQHSLV